MNRNGRAKPSKRIERSTIVISKAAIKSAKQSQRNRPKSAPLESIRHLDKRRLQSFLGDGDAHFIHGKRPVEQVSIPMDGSYSVQAYQVSVGETSPLLRSGARADAQDFERYFWDSVVGKTPLVFSVEPGITDFANGYHAVAFVPDPILVPHGSNQKGKKLPRTIEEMQSLEGFKLKKVNKPLTLTLNSLQLHSTPEMLWVPDEDEDRDPTFTSSGWIVYVVGGYTQTTDSIVGVAPKMRLQSKYAFTLLKPAPRSHTAENLVVTTPASPIDQTGTNTPLPVPRFIQALEGMLLDTALRALAGYVGAQTAADIALLQQAPHYPNHHGQDSFLAPTFQQLVQTMVSGLTIAWFTRQFAPLQKSRDLTTPSSWTSMNYQLEYIYQLLPGVYYSSSDAATGERMSLAIRWQYEKSDGSFGTLPTADNTPNQISGGTASTNIVPLYVNEAEIGIAGQPAPVIRIQQGYQYGGTTAPGALQGPGQVVRPPDAKHDPSPSFSLLPLNYLVDPTTTYPSSFKFGIRGTDKITIYFGGQSWTLGNVNFTPVGVERFSIIGQDEELWARNGTKGAFTRLSDINQGFSL
jgi:hypothetical protein